MLSDKLKSVRIEKGMTQQGLSEASGISRQTISAMEHGILRNTKSGTLIALAKALGVTVDELFSF